MADALPRRTNGRCAPGRMQSVFTLAINDPAKVLFAGERLGMNDSHEAKWRISGKVGEWPLFKHCWAT